MKRPIRVSDVPSAERYATRMIVEPPYANNRINRCIVRSFVSSGDSKSEMSPTSSSARRKSDGCLACLSDPSSILNVTDPRYSERIDHLTAVAKCRLIFGVLMTLCYGGKRVPTIAKERVIAIVNHRIPIGSKYSTDLLHRSCLLCLEKFYFADRAFLAAEISSVCTSAILTIFSFVDVSTITANMQLSKVRNRVAVCHQESRHL